MARKTSITAWLLTGVLAAFAGGFTSAHTGAKPSQASVPQMPVTHVDGAFWKVGPGCSTALILRNQDQQNPATANLTLFSHEGLQKQNAQFTVAAGSTTRVDLADVLKAADRASHWGGLALDFTGNLKGEVLIQDAQSHNGFTLDLLAGYRYDTENALYVPWWLPDQSEGVLSAFNRSDQTIVVTPAIATGQQEQIAAAFSLAPHETKKMNLTDLLAQSKQPGNISAGSITLRYTGPPHALQPALFLSSLAGPFSLAPTVNARHQQRANQQTIWHFPKVALSLTSDQVGSKRQVSATAYALLTNATDVPMAPELIVAFGGHKNQRTQRKAALGKQPAAFRPSERAQKVAVPLLPLMPLETRLVNLSEFSALGLIPAGISHIALTARHAGAAGDLGITVFSVEPASKLVFHSAGILQPLQAVDSTYWSTGKRMALPVVRNETEAPAQVRTTLHFQTAHGVDSYVLPVMDIPARRSRPIGLRQVMLSRITDENGAKIPAGVMSGIATLEIVKNGSSPAGNSVPSAENSAECAKSCDPPPFPSAASGPLATSDPSPSQPAPPPSAGSSSVFEASASGLLASVSGIHFAAANCPPFVTSVAPSTGVAGQSVNVTISGEDLVDAAIDVTGGVTATINSVTPEGTSISATFDIPLAASAVGEQQVVVSNLFGDSAPVGFTVTPPPAPVIEVIDPSSAVAGNLNLPVRIDMTAAGKFQDGDQIVVSGSINTVVESVSPDGVVVNATFQVPACGTTGAQTVTVTDPFGQTSNPATFNVSAPPPPTISSINPNVWQAGSANLPVQIFGTGFACPAIRSSDPTHVVFGTPSFNPEIPGEIDVTVNVDPATPGEALDVFVDINDTGVPAALLRAPLLARSGVAGKVAPAVKSAERPQAIPSKSVRASQHPATSKDSLPNTGSSLIKNNSAAKSSLFTAALVESPPSVVEIVGATPTPQIMLGAQDSPADSGCQGGTKVSGQTKSVAPGQRLFLCVPAPSGFTIKSQQWTVNNNDLTKVVNLYSPALASGTAKKLDPNSTDPLADMKHHTVLLFAVVPHTTLTVSYSYTLEDATGTALPPSSSTATFNVGGPQGINIATTTNPVQLAHHRDQNNVDLGLYLSFGDPLTAGHSGITFNATATNNPAGGQYQWVQLISRVQSQTRKVDGAHTCEAVDSNNNVINDSPPNPTKPVLDSRYPYTTDGATAGNVASTSDNPGFPLTPGLYYEVAEPIFSAKMYLLWDPALKVDGTPCTPASIDQNNVAHASTCDSIPVPLGSIPWSWKGDTVNRKTVAGGTVLDDWLAPNGSGGPTSSFTAATTVDDYPQWTAFAGSAFTGNNTGQQCRP